MITFSPQDMNLEPYWHYLIRHFVNCGYVRNGLTIPFLIGVRQLARPDEQKLSIDALVTWMAAYGATMQECGCIREYVVGSIDHEVGHYADQYQHFGKLLISDHSIAGKTSLTEVADLLTTRYQQRLDAGHFSKDHGEWMGFTEEDMDQLRTMGMVAEK